MTKQPTEGKAKRRIPRVNSDMYHYLGFCAIFTEIRVDKVFYVSVEQEVLPYTVGEPLLSVTYPTLPDDYADIGQVEWQTLNYEGELWGWQPA